jgi:hypothetical protein
MRRRRKRQLSRTARLQEDCERAVRYVEAVLADARRLGVPVDPGIEACLIVLRSWADRIKPG